MIPWPILVSRNFKFNKEISQKKNGDINLMKFSNSTNTNHKRDVESSSKY